MTIADVIYQSALWTPVDFKTVLHVKFPTSKSRQIGFTLLERANDQHSRGDQKTIKGPYLLNSKWQYFNRGFEWTSPNSQHLILQVTIADVIYQSALWTPANFKTILHVELFPSKSRQIGFILLDEQNDQTFSGRPENDKGPHLPNSKWKCFIVVLNAIT